MNGVCPLMFVYCFHSLSLQDGVNDLEVGVNETTVYILLYTE